MVTIILLLQRRVVSGAYKTLHPIHQAVLAYIGERRHVNLTPKHNDLAGHRVVLQEHVNTPRRR
jgi:hypothetical protein